MPSPNGRDDSDANATSYVTMFDSEAGERASEAIVTAVAAIVGTEPIDLVLLCDAVDPDAGDSLVDTPSGSKTRVLISCGSPTRGSAVASEATANVESEMPPRRPAETTPPERSSPAVSPVRR